MDSPKRPASGGALEDRLVYIRRKVKGSRVYYSSYNAHSSYMYDVEDAGEDMLWLLNEVERLRGLLSTGGL